MAITTTVPSTIGLRSLRAKGTVEMRRSLGSRHSMMASPVLRKRRRRAEFVGTGASISALRLTAFPDHSEHPALQLLQPR